jgi:hypothetical protein
LCEFFFILDDLICGNLPVEQDEVSQELIGSLLPLLNPFGDVGLFGIVGVVIGEKLAIDSKGEPEDPF